MRVHELIRLGYNVSKRGVMHFDSTQEASAGLWGQVGLQTASLCHGDHERTVEQNF